MRVVVAEFELRQSRMPKDAVKQQQEQLLLKKRHSSHEMDTKETGRHFKGLHRVGKDDEDGYGDDYIEVLVGDNNGRAVVAMDSVISRGSSSRNFAM